MHQLVGGQVGVAGGDGRLGHLDATVGTGCEQFQPALLGEQLLCAGGRGIRRQGGGHRRRRGQDLAAGLGARPARDRDAVGVRDLTGVRGRSRDGGDRHDVEVGRGRDGDRLTDFRRAEPAVQELGGQVGDGGLGCQLGLCYEHLGLGLEGRFDLRAVGAREKPVATRRSACDRNDAGRSAANTAVAPAASSVIAAINPR